MTDLFLTQSELQLWLRCQRKWWLSVYRRMRIKTVLPYGALMLGTHVHDALAAKYGMGKDPIAVFNLIYAQLMANLPEDQESLVGRINQDHELGRIMLEGYLQWVGETGVDEGLEVIAAEQKVDVPFRPNVRLLSKLDVRVRTRFDQRRFMDHKTAGTLNVPTLHMEFQMRFYHLMEYLLAIEEGLDPTSGTMCDGGYYNMLRKVKRTSRANPPFYSREEFDHNVHELRVFYQHVYELSSRILQMRARLDAGEDGSVIAVPTVQPSCSWSCEWFAVCPMFDDGSDAERFLSDLTVAHDPLERYNERTDEV